MLTENNITTNYKVQRKTKVGPKTSFESIHHFNREGTLVVDGVGNGR